MNIKPIRTDEDHRAALAEIESCWGAAEGTEKGDRLDVLVTLVENYEARRWPIEATGAPKIGYLLATSIRDRRLSQRHYRGQELGGGSRAR